MNKHIEKIKTHLQTNKKVYIAVGITVVTTAAIVSTIFILKSKAIGNRINMTRLWSPGDNNVMKVFISPLGDPGNVIQCIETGTVYASQGQAARELGVNASRISEHLTGKLPNIHGNHLIILGKAGQILAE